MVLVSHISLDPASLLIKGGAFALSLSLRRPCKSTITRLPESRPQEGWKLLVLPLHHVHHHFKGAGLIQRG
jgi:hypothetical protein